MRHRSVPRVLVDNDIAAWEAAVNARPGKIRLTQEEVRKIIRRRNPVRFWRLKRDLRWAERELVRLGASKGDTSWLLQ